jgi:hypothetical protein
MIKLIKLSEYFEIKYGVNLEFQNMKLCNKGIPFVSRTEKNNGITGFVKKIDNIIPNPRNTISVACGGSVMESFLQKNDYYSGRDLFYLKPKVALTDNEMLFYCVCLRANKYKYSYGRQANRTLAEIKIPHKDFIPEFVNDKKIQTVSKEQFLICNKLDFDIENWKIFKLNNFFDMYAGKYYNSNSYKKGKTPLVSSSENNNGIIEFTDLEPKYNNCLTIGKIGISTFYQNIPFIATSDVTVFVPKIKIFNKYIGLFIATILNQEKYKWSYGRQIRLNDSQKLTIKLPTTHHGKPDWEFMENYIKSLPYSASL